MDGEKFDSLVKRFCTTRLTRKNALRGLVASAAAALSGVSFASGDVDARKRRQRIGAASTTGEICACSDNLSPKQCPAGSGNEFTCKLCPGIKKGSVQVKCGDPNICVCQSTECVVGDKKFSKGETVNVCTPEKCADEECTPANACEKNCVCDATTGRCKCEPVICKPQNACEKNCVCDPVKGCVCEPVICKPKDACEKNCTCDPVNGCGCEPVICEPRTGCTVVCDPIKGCVYTCQCLEGESPKQCPEQSGIQFTCKRCPGGNNGGSVQVVCDGSTPHCVCQSKECTIGTTTVPSGTDVTAICPPVSCSTGLPV